MKLENSLSKGEKVIFDSKVSKTCLVPHIILIMFIVGIITIIKPLIAIATTKLCITNKKVIGKTGLIKTKTLDAPLNKINNISVQQGLFAKMFDYGFVRVDTSSGNYSFAYIKDPNGFKSALLEQIDIFDEERIRKQAQILVGKED